MTPIDKNLGVIGTGTVSRHSLSTKALHEVLGVSFGSACEAGINSLAIEGNYKEDSGMSP
jgi:hypothetical protein